MPHLLRHVLLHNPTPPSSGSLSPLIIFPPTHLFAIGNHHSLLKPGISSQPVPVRACLTSRLLPNPVAEPRLPDYPPVAEPCCRPIACPTARLLPTHRLSDYLPVADPSPVRLPACCRTLACPTTACLAWLVVIPFVQINPTVFSSHLRLPVFSVWVHSSCSITSPPTWHKKLVQASCSALTV